MDGVLVAGPVVSEIQKNSIIIILNTMHKVDCNQCNLIHFMKIMATNFMKDYIFTIITEYYEEY